MNDYLDYLKHSAKGSTWHKKKHKYLYIKKGRYYYPYDLKTWHDKDTSGKSEYNISRVYTNIDDEGNRVGIEAGTKYNGDKYVSLYNTKNTKYFDADEDTSKINKKIGSFSIEYAEDGVSYSFTIPKKTIDKAKEFTKTVKNKTTNLFKNTEVVNVKEIVGEYSKPHSRNKKIGTRTAKVQVNKR